jgi:tetratricopeptide (TPR) repeat protein
MADRYAYVPFIGIYLMLIWGAVDLTDVRRAHSSFRVASVLAIGLLAVLCWRQIQYWRSPYDLWSHTLAITTNNYIAEDNMATALLRMGNIEAVAHFQNASRIAPNDPVSHGALAGLYQDQGRFEEAIAYYQIAIRGSSDPDMLAVAEANLAIIYRQTGEYQRARDTYRLAARSSPQALAEMIEGLNGQLARQPAAQGYLRLGLLLDVADRIPEARAAYQQALLLDPGLDQARKALATLG